MAASMVGGAARVAWAGAAKARAVVVKTPATILSIFFLQLKSAGRRTGRARGETLFLLNNAAGRIVPTAERTTLQRRTQTRRGKAAHGPPRGPIGHGREAPGREDYRTARSPGASVQPECGPVSREATPGNTGSAAPDIKAAMDAGEPFWAHAFEYACRQNIIDHRLTEPRHPWTNGQVQRVNRTIRDATVRRLHHETHDQLRSHLADFVSVQNSGRRLKTRKGLTP